MFVKEINSRCRCKFCLRVGCTEHSEKDLLSPPFDYEEFWGAYLRHEKSIFFHTVDLVKRDFKELDMYSSFRIPTNYTLEYYPRFRYDPRFRFDIIDLDYEKYECVDSTFFENYEHRKTKNKPKKLLN